MLLFEFSFAENKPIVPSLHLQHNADNLVTLSANGCKSKISPILFLLKSTSRPATITVKLNCSHHFKTFSFKF